MKIIVITIMGVGFSCRPSASLASCQFSKRFTATSHSDNQRDLSSVWPPLLSRQLEPGVPQNVCILRGSCQKLKHVKTNMNLYDATVEASNEQTK
jgi:hypothetical protein